jgi:hypothetical protein
MLRCRACNRMLKDRELVIDKRTGKLNNLCGYCYSTLTASYPLTNVNEEVEVKSDDNLYYEETYYEAR